MTTPDRPTLDAAEAINELARRNSRTQGRDVAEMWLGNGIFVARLREPKVIEGVYSNVLRPDDVIDIDDLFDMHERGR